MLSCVCIDENALSVAVDAQQSRKISGISTTSMTTSADSKPTTIVSPAPTDPQSTSKHVDSDKRHDHPTTFTDSNLKKPSASKMASSQTTATTMTDDNDLKKPSTSKMASSQSESGGTQLDKPAVKSQASGGSEISQQKSVVVDNEVVTQPPTIHQTVIGMSAAESYTPLG